MVDCIDEVKRFEDVLRRELEGKTIEKVVYDGAVLEFALTEGHLISIDLPFPEGLEISRSTPNKEKGTVTFKSLYPEELEEEEG